MDKNRVTSRFTANALWNFQNSGDKEQTQKVSKEKVYKG